MGFKVGDRVRCVDSKFAEDELEQGKEYEVDQQNDMGVFVKGSDSSYRPDRFELVAPADGWRAVWQPKTRGGWEVIAAKQLADGNWSYVVNDANDFFRSHLATQDGRYFGPDTYSTLDLLPVAPPAPARRPPTREEVAALGFVWVRRKGSEKNGFVAIDMLGAQDVLMAVQCGGRAMFNYDELAELFEYSRDGKAWSEFLVEGQS